MLIVRPSVPHHQCRREARVLDEIFLSKQQHEKETQELEAEMEAVRRRVNLVILTVLFFLVHHTVHASCYVVFSEHLLGHKLDAQKVVFIVERLSGPHNHAFEQ